MTGWVKLHREIPGLRSLPGGQRSVFFTALQNAAWRDEMAIVGGKAINVPRGSWVTNRNEVATLAGVSVKTARTALVNLQKLGLIKYETGQQGAVISLVNPEEWAATSNKTGQQRASKGADFVASKGASPPSIEEEEEEEGKRRAPRKKSTQLPADWTPTEAHHTIGREKGVDVDDEAESFRDYCRANGKTYKNHDAAFSGWLRRQAKWQGERKTARQANEPYQPPLRMV